MASYRCKSSAHGVFGDRSGIHKLEEIVRTARFGANTRHFETPERLTLHQGTCYTPVEIEVSNSEIPSGLFQVFWAAAKDTSGKSKFRRGSDIDGLFECFGFHDRE